MELKNQELLRSQCYVNGQWVDAASGQRKEVFNPADGTLIGTVPWLDPLEVRVAIEAAHAAWPGWRGLSAGKRSEVMKTWHDLLMRHVDDLALIMTVEQGKPLAEAKAELIHGANYIEWFAEEAKRVYGDTIPAARGDMRIVVVKEPVGVCAAITPWNFPSSLIARKAAPALAAGCPVVIKPAGRTPYSALAMVYLAAQAGIPAGVFNVVTGDPVGVGRELSTNALVRKLSFTGSTEVGKILMRNCADTVKNLSLELGGHAPFIVFEDADIEAAVQGAMAAKFRNSGQTCVAANRFIIHEKIYHEFAGRFVEEVKKLRMGNGLEAAVELGPLIDMTAMHKVENQVENALSLGAQLASGGKRFGQAGYFFEPTVLLHVTPDMLIASEETFGPVAPLFSFATDQEAIRLANDTPYGLAAYFYSRDLGRIWQTGEALEYGVVGINTGRMSSEAAPFGGYKESGMGREGSKYGIEEYLEIKYLCFGGLTPSCS